MTEEGGQYRAVTTMPEGMPVMSVQQAIQRRAQLVELVKGMMVAGTDYGKVPGTDKDTLLKPGAEKLNTFFGLKPKFPPVTIVEDWTGKDHNGEPFFYYHFNCELWHGDQMVVSAGGSCNSMESKYRWRWVQETDIPPGTPKASLKSRGGMATEFAFAIDKAETTGKYGKTTSYWEAFQIAIDNETAIATEKAIRSGEMRKAWKINSTVYRMPNDDIASQVNTILKMAQKRALVAATLIAVNASEFFTQDLEDMDTPESNTIEGEIVVSRPVSKQDESSNAPDSVDASGITLPEKKLQPVATPKPVVSKSETTADPHKAAYYALATEMIGARTVTPARVNEIQKASDGNWVLAHEQLVALKPSELPADDGVVAQRAKSRINVELATYIAKYPADVQMNQGQRGQMFALLSKNKVVNDADRHVMFLFLFDDQSTKGMSQAKASIIIAWLSEYPGEVWPVVRQGHLALGQTELSTETA